MTPLTPAVISKLPLGLLGFFGIKNGGQYPQSIVPDIQPVLDLADQLAANYRELVFVAPIAALGFVTANLNGSAATPGAVPAGELWFVQAASVFAFTGVGDSFTGTLEVRNSTTGLASAWHRALSNTITLAASTTQLHPGISGVWLSPGDTIGFWYSAATNASGTAQMSAQLSIVRFPF